MISWLTTLAIILLAVVALWWVPRLAAGRRVAAHSQKFAEELARLASTHGLEDYGRSTMFGDIIYRIGGFYNQLRVGVEVHLGRDVRFARITVEFPQTLDQDLTIVSDRRAQLRRWLLRQKEVHTGDEEFDRDFILLARHERRLNVVLSPAMRFQLRRLSDMVDTLEVGDESVYVLTRSMAEPAEVARAFRKTLELAERIYATAAQLGPSPSRRDASKYEQATTGIYGRVEGPTSSELESSAESGLDSSAASS